MCSPGLSFSCCQLQAAHLIQEFRSSRLLKSSVLRFYVSLLASCISSWYIILCAGVGFTWAKHSIHLPVSYSYRFRRLPIASHCQDNCYSYWQLLLLLTVATPIAHPSLFASPSLCPFSPPWLTSSPGAFVAGRRPVAGSSYS